MSDVEIPQVDPGAGDASADDAPIIHTKAAPIESRFLYVDVAALRAKQLRRGARPRLADDDTPVDTTRPQPRKAERVAMEEVKRGLVLYDVAPAKPAAV